MVILLVYFECISVCNEGIVVILIGIINDAHQCVDECILSVFLVGFIPVCKLLEPQVQPPAFHQGIVWISKL